MSTVTRTRTDIARTGSRKPQATAAIAGLIFAGLALLVMSLKTSPDVLFDDHFGLPMKPDEPYLTDNNIGVTIVMTLIGLSGVGLGVYYFVRNRSVLLLMVALSTALICLPEVFFDVMGGVYFPWSDSEALGHAYTIIGREMPWWIVAGWFGYGSFAAVEYLMLAARPTTRSLWLMFGASLVGDVVFEEVLLKFDTYHYYGNQPLVLLWELPWWWIACNPTGVFLAAALAYRYRDRLQGVKSLAMLVITPLCVGTAYGAVALPSWIAVNGDYYWLVRDLLGLMTLGLGIVFFALTLRLVLNRNPWDMGYAPSEDADEFARA